MIAQNSKNATEYAVFWYNEHYLRLMTLTYFLIRLTSDDKTQSKKLKNSVYWEKYNPFCWFIFTAKIFSKTQFTLLFIALYFILAKKQSLQHSRRNLSAFISHNIRAWTDRNFSYPQTQWSVSIYYRFAGISKSNNFKAFSFTAGINIPQQIKETSR